MFAYKVARNYIANTIKSVTNGIPTVGDVVLEGSLDLRETPLYVAIACETDKQTLHKTVRSRSPPKSSRCQN